MKLGQRAVRSAAEPSASANRVVVVSADDRVVDWLRASLAGFDVEPSIVAADAVVRRWPVSGPVYVPAFAREIAELAPELVLMGDDLVLDDAIALAQLIDREHPEITAVLISPRTANTLDLALRAGTRGVIDPGTDVAGLRRVVADVLEVAGARRRRIAGPVDAGGATTTRVVTVLAAKGGVGKTMLATNLAVALARLAPNETAILDLDLQFGDVATGLGLEPARTITDTVSLGPKLDATSLKAYLTTRASVDLHALCAPLMPSEADELNAEHVGRVIDLLAQQFRYLVIDTTAGVDEFALQAMDRSTDLVVMTSTDVPSIRAAAKELHVLEMLGMNQIRRHIVLNRADLRVGLTVEDIEATLGCRIAHRIPNTSAFTLSLNHGVPLVESDPKAAASRVLIELANDIADVRADRGATARRRERG